MGALVGFEFLRALPARRKAPFASLFVSAIRAPRLFAAGRRRWNLSDDDLLSELLALGRTPRQLLEDVDFRSLVLRVARQDYSALASYTYSPQQAPIDLPIVGFCGSHDHLAPNEHVKAWETETSCDFQLRSFQGGHFYYLDQTEAFVRGLEEATESIVGFR
jgi:surfactin synthase thioesterase subunit